MNLRMKKIKSISKALRLVGIVLGMNVLAHAADPASLPVFSLPDLDGKQWNSSDFKGKPVVVDFWATWCNTCKESIPKLADLSEKYKGKGLVVIGISVDKTSVEKVRKAAKKFGITYLVLHDKENTMAKSFGFSGIPSVYVFNRKGMLTLGMPGFDPEQDAQLVSATEKAL